MLLKLMLMPVVKLYVRRFYGESLWVSPPDIISSAFVIGQQHVLRAGRRVEADDTRRVSTTEATRLRRRDDLAGDRSSCRQDRHRNLTRAQSRTGKRDIKRSSRPVLLSGNLQPRLSISSSSLVCLSFEFLKRIYNKMFVAFIILPPAVGVLSIVTSVSVCLFVSLSICSLAYGNGNGKCRFI